MAGLVTAASSSFATLFGFSIASVGVWMWTYIMSPVIGGGLALIVELIPYIIGLALILIVVFFGYKAWHMWRGH